MPGAFARGKNQSLLLTPAIERGITKIRDNLTFPNQNGTAPRTPQLNLTALLQNPALLNNLSGLGAQNKNTAQTASKVNENGLKYDEILFPDDPPQVRSQVYQAYNQKDIGLRNPLILKSSSEPTSQNFLWMNKYIIVSFQNSFRPPSELQIMQAVMN
jgi:hypothetical protein